MTLPKKGSVPTPSPSLTAPAGVAEPLAAQAAVLQEALELYAGRASERAEVWRRSGIKGQAFHVLAKAERGFLQAMAGELPNRDHYVDLVNYACFLIRLLDEIGDNEGAVMALNGDWPWPT